MAMVQLLTNGSLDHQSHLEQKKAIQTKKEAENRNRLIGKNRVDKWRVELLKEKEDLQGKIRVVEKQGSVWQKKVLKAALDIQRYVRGWLTRVRFDKEWLKYSAKNNVKSIRELNTAIQEAWTVSITVKEAIQKIYRYYMKYLFYKKIKRLQTVWDVFKGEKVLAAQELAKRQIRSYGCQIKLKNLAELRIFQRKIDRIKCNLATYLIRKYWNDNQLNIRILKGRIRRYKYRKIYQSIKPNPTQNTTKLDDFQQEKSAQESAQVQKPPEKPPISILESPKIRKKVNLLKIAHNISDFNPPLLCGLDQRGATYLKPTQASLLQGIPRRIKPIQLKSRYCFSTRNTPITSLTVSSTFDTPQRRKIPKPLDAKNSLLRSTIAFTRKLSCEQCPKGIKKRRGSVINNHFLSPTKSSAMKQNYITPYKSIRIKSSNKTVSPSHRRPLSTTCLLNG